LAVVVAGEEGLEFVIGVGGELVESKLGVFVGSVVLLDEFVVLAEDGESLSVFLSGGILDVVLGLPLVPEVFHVLGSGKSS